MSRSPFRVLIALLAALSLSAPVLAGELSGVKMPDQISVAAQPLVLNGMGVRKIAIIKVYVAGLYTAARTKDAAAILASRTPRAVRIELVRDVDKGRLTNGFKEGIAKNGGTRVAAHQAHINTFLSYFGDQKKGTVIMFADAAEAGLVVTVGNEVKGIIGDREFADLVFGIWLGANPPSGDLKKGLLGA